MSSIDINQLTFTNVSGAGTLGAGVRKTAALTAPCFYRQGGKLLKAEIGDRLVRFSTGKVIALNATEYAAAFSAV